MNNEPLPLTVKELKEMLYRYPDYFTLAFDGGTEGYLEIMGAFSMGTMVVIR